MSLHHGSVPAAERPKRPTPEAQFLKDAGRKLDERLFGKADAKQCAEFMKRAGAVAKPRFALVHSRYLRVMEQDPVAALKSLGPWVMGKDKVRDWEKAQAGGEKEALAKWQEEHGKANRERREELEKNKPAGLFAPFPAPDQWRVDSQNADLAIEIARCHVDLHRHQEALAIIDSLGKGFAGETRALAAECAGDLMVKMQMLRKGVDWYGFALKVLDSLKSPSDVLAPDHALIRARVNKSLAMAKRLLEIEQYGPGWVAYRDAEQKRRGERDFLSAYLKYEDIEKEFPQTVYAAAAACCRVRCLLALAEEANAKRAKESIARREHDLA